MFFSGARVKMQNLVAIMILLLAQSSFARDGGGGVDVGNGGNGIQNADGTVLLVDMAELDIDPDSVVLSNFSSKLMNTNFTVRNSVGKLLKSKFERDGYKADERVITALSTQLSALSYRYPTFVKRLMDSIEKMVWERTPSLEPNLDAKMKLVLGPDQKEIGCAENKFGRVQVSIICEKGMSPGHFAALIVHEAVYAYLASKDNRIAEGLEDSTPARRIVAEVFRAKADDILSPNLKAADAFHAKILGITLPGDKEIVGLKELFSEDQQINSAFFPGNRSFNNSYTCKFQNNDPIISLKNVAFTLQFRGAYYASGLLKMSEDNPFDYMSCDNQIFGYANRGDAVQNACLINPKYQLPQSWLISDLPNFAVEKSMLSLTLMKLSSREKMVLNISTNRETPSTLEIYRGYNASTDRYSISFAVDGACSFIPESN